MRRKRSEFFYWRLDSGQKKPEISIVSAAMRIVGKQEMNVIDCLIQHYGKIESTKTLVNKLVPFA